MKYFYHSGSLGDMIYSLPTVQAMGGGVFVTGMGVAEHNAIAPLLLQQPYIYGVLHVSSSGLPPDFINLSNFRNHPLFTRLHIVELHAEVQGVKLGNWQKGWLVCDPKVCMMPGRAVINVTPRYRDKFFRWRRELIYLENRCGRIYFIGTGAEFGDFVNRNKLGKIARLSYIPTDNLAAAKDVIESVMYFSGNQSAMLAIRQGLGLPYRFEQSPNHLDTEQGSDHETILNPITRRIHLAAICAKKAFFDIKTKRYHA